MRLLVQSQSTGRFLAPSLDDGQPEWFSSLREAGGGVVHDVESAHQLVQDWCEPEDRPQLIDLDRLGTEADYLPLIRSQTMSEEVDGIDLECPKCGAVVGYDDVQEVDDQSAAGCPECGESSPTEDWFS